MVSQSQLLNNQNNVVLLQDSKGKTTSGQKKSIVDTQPINNCWHKC